MATIIRWHDLRKIERHRECSPGKRFISTLGIITLKEWTFDNILLNGYGFYLYVSLLH